MSEETVVESQVQEVSPVEQRAIDAGWRPKEEWEGPEEKWVPADEFLRRGELFDKIHDLNKELHGVKQAFKQLADHHAKLRALDRKQEIESLKEAKKAAIEENDGASVVEIDEQITALREEDKQDKQAVASAEPHPDFTAWFQQNQWYANDAELHDAADAIGVAYTRRNPNAVLKDVLNYVTDRMKKSYPEKFGTPKKEVSRVETSSTTRTSSHKKGLSWNDLSDEEKKVCDTFTKRIPNYTREMYLEELNKIKE